ncbi:hypothetical protein Tco_0693846 [Tanacetum coccineum]
MNNACALEVEVEKAHLLDGRKNPSVGVVMYLAFGGITGDLGLHLEKKDKTMVYTKHLSRLCSQRLETASQDTRDSVKIHSTTVSQHLKTASIRTTQPKI